MAYIRTKEAPGMTRASFQVLLIAACAAATTQAATAEEAAATGAQRDAEPEVVCRVEAELGSRVKKKVCRRKADIEAERSETQDVLRDVRSLGNKNYSAAPGN